MVDIRETEICAIEPDYKRNFHDIYEDLLKHEVECLKTLRLLQYCELRESAKDLPTWVPDWSIPPLVRPLRFSEPTGYLEPEVQLTERGVLRALGLHVGTIQQVDIIRLEGQLTQEEMIKEFQRLITHMDMGPLMRLSDGFFKAFMRTLCADVFSDRLYPPLETASNFQQSMKDLHEVFFGEKTISADLGMYFQEVLRYTLGRSFFDTDRMDLGLAPKGAQENDLVCILLGCDSVLVLRPAGNGQYQVVGQAYCYGVMSGEAILGPLPDCFDVVYRFVEVADNYQRPYIERETATVLEEDPRSGSLPTGWRKISFNGDPNRWFVNDENGREPTSSDPRLTPEALRKRGVDLKVFEII